ncbi:MAB_1171c family putative transporter [Streptomyces sp. W16]|uniref:MAB_1171c family putative transporter n=1 Tax=Streptomyces sp. W16 TaxID=3076631 RepID=UPI00295B0412|nr:MAB_1171c family putative transporter [Streptomyces sp. W16]MDV9173043.1 MAB_1171c family putative transporter [Streptomyces sp. W16]
MISLLFSGVAIVLLLTAGYWVRGRNGQRPTGTWAMAALLVSFALAFASYVPFVESAVESLVPHVGRLLSNSFTLAAATSVLAFLLQLNLEPDEAIRSIRLRVLFLCASVAGMAVLFAAEQLTDRSPKLYACYVLIYVSYLGVTAKDFCEQTWRQSKRSRRRSQRIGLRVTSAGCVFALLYSAYKVFGAVSVGFGLGLIPENARCSTPVTPFRCGFSVTAPALAVLLIALGLTLPAVAWPFSQFLRRRWETRSYAALGPLWQDVTGATPEVVLAAPELNEKNEKDADDSDFLLHRRVIEINDGALALRPHRSPRVQESAERGVAARGMAGTPEGDAIVEAAVLRAAVHAKQAGSETRAEAAPPAPGASSREGNLRAETEWLLLVARAYAQDGVAGSVADELTPAGTDPQA